MNQPNGMLAHILHHEVKVGVLSPPVDQSAVFFAEQTKKTSEEIKRRADQAGVQDTDRCRPHDIIRTDPQCGFIRRIHNAEAIYRSVATHTVAEQEGHRRYLVLIPERVMGLNQRLERIGPTFGYGPLKMTDSSVYWLA